MGSLPMREQRCMILASVVRVPSSHRLSSIPLHGQLLAKKSFPSKLPFCFWAAVPVRNIQGRMGSFELAFYDAGMTCKGPDPALDRSAMLVPSWPLFSRPPGAIRWAGVERACVIHDLQHCCLRREGPALLPVLLGRVAL